jgi:hypothetical protein
MKVQGLKQACFNTTLMGVVRGVADHFGVSASDATLFGGSGHAFMINIHEQLCPSGPYCWDRAPFLRLLRTLGIAMTDLGFYTKASPPSARREVEARLAGCLDEDKPCSLMNMENQLITGYDERGFDTAQPWAPRVDFPPARLTFGSWEELGEEIHLSFYAFDRCEPADPREAVLESLDYAADVHANPADHTKEPYGAGPGAYWAECRRQAASYLEGVADAFPEARDAARGAAARYGVVAEGLQKVSDKGMDAGAKVALLQEIAEEEAQGVAQVEECAAGLRAAVAPAR